jgi:phospholipase D1/2
VTKDNDPETWHVQVFRSIDSGSVKGFPKIAEEVQQQHLVWGKSVAIDVSIQMAYIKAIRSAQHFIYIENQYFLGSSYNWPDYDKAGANHLIPMELALKICSKIRAGQMFAVYVVVPMWPEGVPESAPVQEILYFQVKSFCHLTDFLNESHQAAVQPALAKSPIRVYSAKALHGSLATLHKESVCTLD